MNRRAFGSAGEDAACVFLKKRGWTVIARNVRLCRGEIDVIAQKGGITAFIEVKRRSGTAYGQPAEAVNPEKQRRIARAAAAYAQANGLDEANLRFDVIEMLPGEIRLIEAAFDATGLL